MKSKNSNTFEIKGSSNNAIVNLISNYGTEHTTTINNNIKLISRKSSKVSSDNRIYIINDNDIKHIQLTSRKSSKISSDNYIHTINDDNIKQHDISNDIIDQS